MIRRFIKKYGDDGKITFSSADPIVKIEVLRAVGKKPTSYNDFYFYKTIDNPYAGGFKDSIEPNVKYYYLMLARNVHGYYSNPSAVYEVEMIKNSGAVYPSIKIIELETKDESRHITNSFKNEFKIKVKYDDHVFENPSSAITKQADITLDKFGKKTPSIFNKKFKIRITSKTTKKKIDINVIFDRTINTDPVK